MQKAAEVTNAPEYYRRLVPVSPSNSAASSGEQKGEGGKEPKPGTMARGSPSYGARMVHKPLD